MSLESVIYSRASTFAGLTALIGTRFYPNKLPQDPTFPCARYQVVDSVPVHSMLTSSGMEQARVQISFFDRDYSDCIAVREQLLLCFSRWRNAASDPVIDDTLVIDARALYEDEIELHHFLIDFLFITK